MSINVSKTYLEGYYRSLIGCQFRKRASESVWPEREDEVPFLSQKNYLGRQKLEPDRFSFIRQLKDAAKNNPLQTMFIDKTSAYSASEIYSRIKKAANGFKQIGIKSGDKVALMALPHERELFESFLALQAIGAIPVMINFLTPPASIAFQFLCSDAKTLIVGRDSRLRTGANKLVLAGILERVITIGKTDFKRNSASPYFSRSLQKIVDAGLSNLFFKYEYLRGKSELKDEEIISDPEKYAPAMELYTSGTSKRPRRMTYTYDAIANATEVTSQRFNITENDRWLFPVPFYHLAGLIVFCGANQYKNPIVLTEVPRASEDSTIEQAIYNIENKRVTIFPGVPRIIEPVIERALERNLLLKDLRMIFSGAAPMTPKLIKLIDQLNDRRKEQGIKPVKIINFYASTECGPISATTKPITLENIDCLGLPFDTVETKLSDDGSDELFVKPQQFPPEIQEENLTPDGFFKTGDQVYIAPDKLLFYKDRLTDRLNVNGEKISPITIQRELEKIPSVKEAHVFGIPKQEQKTDIVCAILIPKKGQKINQDSIWEQLHKKLDDHLKAFIPTVIFIEPDGIPDSMIRGPGKTPRKVFREKYGEQAIKEYSKGAYKDFTPGKPTKKLD